MYYANPTVDELISKAVVTPDAGQRMKLYRDATQIIVDDVPDVFTYRSPDVSIRRQAVQGYYHDPIYRRALHYYDLHKTAP